MLKPTVEKHFELLDKILKTKDQDTLQALCEIDASIAAQFKVEWYDQFPHDHKLPRYPAFQKLAIIYEKAGNYPAAIAICEKAISLGFDNDGTKGGMTARVERLKKKLEKLKRPRSAAN